MGGSESNKHASKRKVRVAQMVRLWYLVLYNVMAKSKQKLSAKQIFNVTETTKEFVAAGSTTITDEHHAYNKLNEDYEHRRVNHREKEYVRYEDIIVHTNSIEGFWNILKKQIDGIHHSVSAKHLQRYCNESAFRYNHRKIAQDERFADALANCNGSLKYKVLTAKEDK